ncbi:hypothetical protein EYF80_059532 [Liparis tanakae]|uniref:Uncharacterized protein n=1 Tax=Liparis tanakae TaxID=230148 RepID=A0A4Z2EN56_9TELE|nr:hypothetical protein EYF80_059532 [Liparis tanakae]
MEDSDPPSPGPRWRTQTLLLVLVVVLLDEALQLNQEVSGRQGGAELSLRLLLGCQHILKLSKTTRRRQSDEPSE